MKEGILKTKRYWIYIAAGTLFLLGVFAGVIGIAQELDPAQIREEFRRRLGGSDGVNVYISVITKEKSDEESLMKRLQEDVERELQDAEIKVLSKSDLDYVTGRPRLGVFLVIYKEPSSRDFYIYTFQIIHFENATLERNYRYAEGVCWDSGRYVGRDKMNSIVRSIRTHVQRYISDYLAANPKPPKQDDETLIP
jgi:hypothetical protein